ncbi:DUF1540 domain-containing protein [Petroclostridium sp. X23]|jgi:hypothetical protein|uniref:DUF1540 domain-containing protein n=1 Tax=Petroclostridium sp. X23 TaxID=3045146 RepID=UPI0024AD9361|nr:DUF1540 domain-containing protein [Petroclostridium sp. X23]WHH60259.1 DUF1540 domain-containing protein [Petroclostridium sp. X23]
MQSRVEKQNQPLGGVKCVVNSCEFYGNGDHCMASAIEVQPRNAQDTQETDCATFKPKH